MTEAGCICQIAKVKMESSLSLMRIRVDMIQTVRIKSGCPADDAMHLIAFCEQELGQVRSILSRDSGNQGLPRGRSGEQSHARCSDHLSVVYLVSERSEAPRKGTTK